MTKKDEEDNKNKNNCQFCDKEVLIDKIIDHCHLFGKYRGPAHQPCNNIVTQKQSVFFHLFFTISVIMIVICFSGN